MLKDAFAHVRVWVFDLDNTLYPPSAGLFERIKPRMTRYVMEALGVDEARARHLREEYWRRYGTTLAGLMQEHGVDPGPYLHDVHDIALDDLSPDPELRARIAALPGRRIVYTNGPQSHAERVVAARGLSGVFDALYGVEQADFHPKPTPAAYGAIFARAQIDTRSAAMFEDDPRNLKHPHALGMTTVLVGPRTDRTGQRADNATGHGNKAAHIHYRTDDLAAFLGRITR